MGREWNPGDVALVNDCTHPAAPWKAATCKEAAVPGRRETVWILHDSGTKVWGSVSDARPLVVIDPENEKDVERLNRLYWDTVDAETAQADMQVALREFANPTPPRPDEPTGLGAVVEDDQGRLFVNIGTVKANWRHGSSAYEWFEISATNVVSAGI